MSPFAGLAFHPLDGIMQVCTGWHSIQQHLLQGPEHAARISQMKHFTTTLPDPGLQALPYSWTLFYVPMHFLTHEMLLFFTSIWTTNIHDNVHAKVRLGHCVGCCRVQA